MCDCHRSIRTKILDDMLRAEVKANPSQIIETVKQQTLKKCIGMGSTVSPTIFS